MHLKPISSLTASQDASPLLLPKYDTLKETFIPFDLEGRGLYAFNLIRLNPGVTVTNYVCSQLYYVIMMFSFAMTDSLQPLILLSKDYYHVDGESAGLTLSSIIVLQLIVKMLVAILYGHLNDKFGRRKMIIFGAINFAIGCFLAPIQRQIFPGFILAKTLLSNGASALGIVPLNADYVHDDSKGKAAGITISFIATGAALANIFLKLLFHLHFSLGKCYFITGVLVIVLFGTVSLGLKGGKYYLLEKRKDVLVHEDKSLYQNAKEAYEIFMNNPWLTIAIILQTLGNSDFFVASVLLTLYVKSLFPPGTQEFVSNFAINNLQTAVFLPALISNVVYGVYIDRTGKIIGGTILALGGGAVAFLLTCFVESPYDWHLYLSALLMGLTVPGVYVTGNYLGIRHFPKDKRGIMYGMMTLIGYFGYVIVALGGGYLFDHWRKNGPFIVYTGLLILALIFVERIYVKKIKNAPEMGRKKTSDVEMVTR